MVYCKPSLNDGLNPLIVQFSPEGSFWQDPPNYWDDIVWPAYIKAHKNMFEGGDVSRGEPIIPKRDDYRNEMEKSHLKTNGAIQYSTSHVESTPSSVEECGQPISDLIVLPAEQISMVELFEKACENVRISSIV
jgi:hypothetical protein